jgi:hypothetical protein
MIISATYSMSKIAYAHFSPRQPSAIQLTHEGIMEAEMAMKYNERHSMLNS